MFKKKKMVQAIKGVVLVLSQGRLALGMFSNYSLHLHNVHNVLNCSLISLYDK